jgi:APA family basic amino acid/polyamine antiporter
VIGVALYLILLAPGARLADATAEARDPDLARLRGRSPLVLVPIANPASAASLVGVAATVRTPGVGRILLLSVVVTPDEVPDEDHPALRDAQAILGESLQRGFERASAAEALFTVAPDAFEEIARVARVHGCETVLLGAPKLAHPDVENRLASLVETLDADIVLVRAPRRWRIAQVEKVLVPLGGRPVHSHLRARLLASLTRSDQCRITFLFTVPSSLATEARARFEHGVREFARDTAAGHYEVIVEEVDDPGEAILRHAVEHDLVVMGMRRRPGVGQSLGALALGLARNSDVPMILIGGRRSGSMGIHRG